MKTQKYLSGVHLKSGGSVVGLNDETVPPSKREICMKMLRRLEREAGHLEWDELDKLANAMCAMADRIRRGHFISRDRNNLRSRKGGWR